MVTHCVSSPQNWTIPHTGCQPSETLCGIFKYYSRANMVIPIVAVKRRCGNVQAAGMDTASVEMHQKIEYKLKSQNIHLWNN